MIYLAQVTLEPTGSVFLSDNSKAGLPDVADAQILLNSSARKSGIRRYGSKLVMSVDALRP